MKLTFSLFVLSIALYPKLTLTIPLKEQWFKNFLDHRNPIDLQSHAQRWNQRYFVNSEFYKEGGPVLLMIGGEGPAEPEFLRTGEMIELAKEHGALCILLEHRFYGRSHPLPDTSLENLKYLNVEQALADTVFFVEEMQKNLSLPSNTKWITYGCSYAGTLSAWVRLKYPHFIHGAISISAPMLATLDFREYFVAVEKSLETHSTECANTILTALKQMDRMLHNHDDQQKVEKLFNLCDPIDPAKTTRKDIANLYKTIYDIFSVIVQNNLVNRNESSVSIDRVCDILVDEKKGDPVQRLAKLSNIMLIKEGKDCLDYQYSKMILNLKNTNFGRSAEGVEYRQWRYQSCTEIGFHQTLTAKTHFFNRFLNIQFFIQQCGDIFGPRFAAEPAVKRTNVLYGGLDIVNYMTNIVFVHGSIDPWHVIGVTQSDNPHAPAIFINGTAHCAIFFPSSPKDLPQLTQARKRISALIRQWLQ